MIKINKILNEDLEVLSLWHDTIRLAGLDVDNVLNDLKNIKIETDEFSFNNILKQADELKGLNSRSRAIRQGKLWGYGEDLSLFLSQGSEGILKLLAEAKEKGYGLSEEELKALQKAYQQGEALNHRMEQSRTIWSRELAGPVSDGFDLINSVIAENEEKLNGWAKTTGKIAGGTVRFFEGFAGVIPEPSVEAEARLESDDPGIRDKEKNDRGNASLLRDLGGAVRLGCEAARDITLGTTIDPRRLIQFYGRLDGLIADIEEARKPIDDVTRAALSNLDNPNHLQGLQHPLWDVIAQLEMEGSHDYVNPEKYRSSALPIDAIGNAEERIPPADHKNQNQFDFGMLNSLEVHGSFDNSSIELFREAAKSFVPVERGCVGYPDYSGDWSKQGNGGSGVTIENQTIHVQVNGARDPFETGSEIVQIMKAYCPGGGPIAIF